MTRSDTCVRVMSVTTTTTARSQNMSKYAILATHDHTGHSAWLATRSANGPWTRDASSRLELDWQDVPASMNVAWENLMRRAEQDHEFDVHSHSVKIVEVQS